MWPILTKAVKIAIFVVFVVLLTLTFEKGAYLWASCIIGSFIYFLLEEKMGIERELGWISDCLISNESLKQHQEFSRMYSYIHWSLMEGKIKNGISIEELADFIKKNYMYSTQISSLAENKEKALSGKVVFTGYGFGMPTPRLILKFRKRKLTSWREQ